MARASNLVIGTATLAVIAVAFGGLLGVQKWRTAQSRSQLRVVFEGGSASGLRRGGPVNFDGVPAGQILSIKLDNPRKVVALVSLDNAAPIRKDTVAGIEFQGLTGVAAVSLIGGGPLRSAGAARRRRHPRADRRSQRRRIHRQHPA
ncbi:ABC-type transporter Mla subunit MlaD [Bradyrhizobium sp. LB7.1]